MIHDAITVGTSSAKARRSAEVSDGGRLLTDFIPNVPPPQGLGEPARVVFFFWRLFATAKGVQSRCRATDSLLPVAAGVGKDLMQLCPGAFAELGCRRQLEEGGGVGARGSDSQKPRPARDPSNTRGSCIKSPGGSFPSGGT